MIIQLYNGGGAPAAVVLIIKPCPWPLEHAALLDPLRSVQLVGACVQQRLLERQ